MKIMLPTEQALSMYAFSADTMGKANAGDEQAANLLRHPHTGLQVPRLPRPHPGRQPRPRGARRAGLHREWVTARLVRDAQIGTLWEGTSNINRWTWCSAPSARVAATRRLTAALKDKYEPSNALPGQYKGLLGATLDRVGALRRGGRRRP